MRSLLCRALGAEPHELPALGWAFAYFFLLLCSYYILRPVRDEMAVQAGLGQLQWLFTATFVAIDGRPDDINRRLNVPPITSRV